MTLQPENIFRNALATAVILLILSLVYQFSDEVVWDLTDFSVAGAIGIVFPLIWAELAVSIFGTPFAGS